MLSWNTAPMLAAASAASRRRMATIVGVSNWVVPSEPFAMFM